MPASRQPPGRPSSRRTPRSARAATVATAAVLALVAVTGCSDSQNAPDEVTAGASPAAEASAPGEATVPSQAPTLLVTTGQLAPTCMFIDEVNRTAATSTSSEHGLELLRAFEPRFQQTLARAPAPVEEDVHIVLSAASKSLRDADLSSLATDEVALAGTRLVVACGLGRP